MTVRTLAVHFMLGLFLVPAMALAQAQGGGDQGGRQRGNFDPAQMQARMMASYKERLGATDEEWRILQPKVEKLMTLQRNTRGGMMGGRGQRGGDQQAESAVAVASRELRTVLENTGASADEIGRKLTALREAREKARVELVAAQKELKELVTVRQEAVLVSMGMLD